MTKVLAFLFCVMLLASPAAANEKEYVVGWVIGFDELTDEVFLHNGKAYVAAPEIDFSMLLPGERFLLELGRTSLGKEIVMVIPVPVLTQDTSIGVDS